MIRDLWRNLLLILYNHLRRTTTHGLPNVVKRHNKFLKIMWLTFFLTSISYCSYTLVRSIQDYSRFETTVKITVTQDTTTEFPAVSICMLNPFDTQDIYNYGKWPIFQPIFQELGVIDERGKIGGVNWTKITNSMRPKVAIERYMTQVRTVIASKYRKDPRMRRFLGFDLEQHMLLSCSFNKVECDSSQFSHFWSNYYGNCYTFNSGRDANGDDLPILKTSRPGINYGLEMEILAADVYFLSYFMDQVGLYLVVHNRSTQASLLTNGIHVATGLSTYVPISRTFHKKLPKPYTDCVVDLNEYKKISDYSAKLYEYMSKTNVNEYNKDFCYKLCFQDHLNTECKCSDLNIPIINDNFEYCQLNTELECLSRVNAKFSSNLETLCKSSCPPQCDTLKYDLFHHTATYPPRSYYDELMRASNYWYNHSSPYKIILREMRSLYRGNVTYSERNQILKEGIVKVNINYNEISYTTIEEIPAMTFETLLGVLGGQLALFIGISLLSIVELLELVIEILLACYKSHKMNHNETLLVDLETESMDGLEM